MIKTKNIASKKMLSTISMLQKMNKLSHRTLYGFSSHGTQTFSLPKRKLYHINQIEVEEYNNLKTVVFKAQTPSKHHIIYLHGGAYQLKGKQNHYQFLSELNQSLEGTISMIDYPTSAESTAQNTVLKTKEAVQEIMNQNPDASFYLCGDSAGGGLALVLDKLLRQDKDNCIKALFLMSPWVDLSMINKEIDALLVKEFMFSKEELLQAAHQYAGGIALNDILLSPIYDDCYNIDKITIYAGNQDILFPDIKQFTEQNPKITLYEYLELPHVFPLFPGGIERLDVIDDIVHRIKGSML